MRTPFAFQPRPPASTASFPAAAARLSDATILAEIRQDLPMYVFSGSEDPVGQGLAGVRALINRYHKAGISDISYDFYEGGRHEMLNETNRGEVRTNLLVWISNVLGW